MTEQPKELDWVQSVFLHSLQERRRQFPRFLVAAGVFAFSGAIAVAVRQVPGLNHITSLLTIGAWFAIVGVLFSEPRIRCVKCDGNVETGVGRFCPECGAEDIRKGTWFARPYCGSCGLRFTTGRGGSGRWLIRFCTHCGVRLHETGARI